MKGRSESKSPSPGRNTKHWTQRIRETVLSVTREGILDVMICGGADNGQFCYLGDIEHSNIHYFNGKLQEDEVILEIQGRQVGGFTHKDAIELVRQISKNQAPILFKTTKTG
ncbi:unnamed protein product [Dimorphilus gyrociliatus]|uniref:PDZ domain-containing protein n=1 Tax=Dimorphilus gyrociliatus TaxID=2664684 RepID=A0A7I8W174_9ANNE|nr:unnamed protein product [Dimorphilus gyrociliatus]